MHILREISKNRAATNSVEGFAPKKEQSRERQRFLLSTRSQGVELTKTVRFSGSQNETSKGSYNAHAQAIGW